MCLYPRKYVNKKYTATEKNEGCVPLPPVIGKDKYGTYIYDERVLYIEIPCGNCEECRKAIAREWQVRMLEELEEWEHPYYITLTFSPEQLGILCKKYDLNECNAVAGIALRRMLERWRRTHKKSLKHWFITELGHEGTERIHMHGVIFTNDTIEFGEKNEDNMCKWKYWKYGHIYVGDYCTKKTINYITKYINKIDTDHKGFKGQILASPGIGKSWLDKIKYKPVSYGYRPKHTIDYYILNNGSKIKLPKYYSNHLRTEEERELIWREFMDREKQSVNGVNYDMKTISSKDIQGVINKAQENNIKDGYGDDSIEWRKKTYNITKRMLQKQERDAQIKKMATALRVNNYIVEKRRIAEENCQK